MCFWYFFFFFFFFYSICLFFFFFFFFQAEDGIRDGTVTGVQTCALPICLKGLEGAPLVVELLPFSDDERRALETLQTHYKLAIPPYYFSLIDPFEIGRASCRERV